ncbi:ABC transporter G family member 22 isoform X2 [Spinacia oleracea]|uniref:ABC transporter G family member 22 isoform X2 n=1 Tax=Spinacia oleracea TaxID=3562 RepID=A0ABM3QJY1_SPIOL|nr:ABC transporter G family member 22-like isoform X2 [Spinacia oleracea]
MFQLCNPMSVMEVNEGPSSPKQGNDKIGEGAGFCMLRGRSLESEKCSSINGAIRKTKSFNSQILINTDELVKNVSRRFNSIGFPSNNHFNIAFAFQRMSCPHPQLSADETGQEETEQQDMSPDSSMRSWNIEPSLPICLRFEDVKFKVTMNSEGEKYILHGVSGSATPGELLAMIGPSGGGKTTLLNLLSGRLKFNSGTITYNNQPYSKSLKRKIGFVMQDDVAFPHLTVKETLTYAALLRLPNTLTKDQKRDRAMEVITDLALERCQNSMIGGGLLKGISGGERRRVCIANEILLNPPLLLLDEPTSSLDSASALRIVQILHNIAKTGKTVVTTIHQPSSRLFSKFDKLILIGKGSSLYFGKASEAMMYFSSMGCSPLRPMNPAEFLLDLANGNMNDKSVPLILEDKLSPTNSTQTPSSLEVHEYFVEACESRSSKIGKSKLSMSTIQQSEMKSSSSKELGASWSDQFRILLSRGIKERRHEYFSSVRVIQVVSTAIIMGLIWWHPNHSSSVDLQDQAGLLFFISVFWGFFPLLTAIFTFPQERVMLIKERSAGMYRLSAYFAARNITDLPLDLILPIFFMLIVYFMVGLQPSFAAFFLTLLTVFLSIVAAQGLGLSIGAAFMDIKKAMTLGSVIIMSFMLAAGFFIQDVPSFMYWVRYVSFNYHIFRLLLKIQHGCSKSGSCEAPVIKGVRVDYSGKVEVAALIIMIIGYRFLAYLFLRRMKLKAI